MDHESPSQLYYSRESGQTDPSASLHRSLKRINTGESIVLREMSPDPLPFPVARENLVLGALPPETLHKLDPYLTWVQLKKQQFLRRDNDSLGFVYFPVTAVISDFSLLADGRMVEIAITGREGAVGLSPYLLGMDSAADITQVSQAGMVRRIDAATLTVLLGSNEQWQRDLKRCLSLYIKQISQRALCNMYHSVEGRLCTWLLMVQDRCGLTTMKLTQEHLSHVLGVYRPTVTNIAQDLRRDEVIDCGRGTISIRDHKRVEELACACYDAPAWATNQGERR